MCPHPALFQSACIILTDNISNKSLQDCRPHHIPVKTSRIAFTASLIMREFCLSVLIWLWMHSKPAERFLLKDAARRSSCSTTSSSTPTPTSSATATSTSILTWPGPPRKVRAPALPDAQLQLGDAAQAHGDGKAQHLDSGSDWRGIRAGHGSHGGAVQPQAGPAADQSCKPTESEGHADVCHSRGNGEFPSPVHIVELWHPQGLYNRLRGLGLFLRYGSEILWPELIFPPPSLHLRKTNLFVYSELGIQRYFRFHYEKLPHLSN